jgi:hypothetical protein
MGSIGKDFKYKIIKNFLSKDERDILTIYCEIKHRNNFSSFDFDQSNNADTRYYGDAVIDSLLVKKKKLIERECGKNLLGTYSFWRAYTRFADLPKHTDRPACEISVTVSIGGDDVKWPIFMDGTSISLEKGDAALYLGCEVSHWREEFEGDCQFQCFLHYVDADGENKQQYLDKRNNWGQS